jgi:pimeloyl-ACP methyl ester carboxylesterase
VLTQRTVPSDGVTLAAVEAGDATRPTIVFIHGYPDTKEVWGEVLDRLAGRFHVVAYDVRGAGASSAPHRAADYDFARLGDDLLAVLDSLAPGQRVHLVGHDWGGIQGWEFATDPRFEGRLASFTAIAAPSLDQIAEGSGSLLRRGRILQSLRHARRSWYVVLLCTPGGPSLMWRVLMRPTRWRWVLRRREAIPVDGGHPAPTLTRDGLSGANLYRRNIPRRMLRPRTHAKAHVPVQLIIPAEDRFIPEQYYERAERHVQRLRRRRIPGSHWAPLTEPQTIAEWVAEQVEEGLR